MAAFDDPPARLPVRLYALGLRFFFTLLDMRLIVACLDGFQRCLALVSGIGAEMLRIFGRWFRPRRHHGLQCGLQQLHVMHVCTAGDERQRDTTGVD